jgi:hypothetical protein
MKPKKRRINKMINLQEKYKKFFSGICYAFCMVKKFKPNASDADIARDVLDGWDAGYLDDDGYVSSPVQFINNIIKPKGIEVRDVEKIDFKKEELTEDTNIVMWEYDGGTHFVVMNREGDVIFDPSGNSKTVKYGIPVSIRKYILTK